MLSIEGFTDSSGGGMLPSAASLQQQQAAAAGAGASVYIKGMPEDADKLWLYEKFSRFGGICSVRVLVDEQSGKCNGECATWARGVCAWWCGAWWCGALWLMQVMMPHAEQPSLQS